MLHLVFPPLHWDCYECKFITLNEKSLCRTPDWAKQVTVWLSVLTVLVERLVSVPLAFSSLQAETQVFRHEVTRGEMAP